MNFSQELLKSLHLLTRDGALNADARRKLKQVEHLIQLLKPALEAALQSQLHSDTDPVIVDLGAGKSYLGFLLYEAWLKERASGRMICVESRSELVEKSKKLAQSAGYERMQFLPSRIIEAASALPESIALVTALHACDTATDDALDLALAKKAKWIAVVPCCQASVAEGLRRAGVEGKKPQPEALARLWAHPIQRREFGSELTNVLRVMRLEASGYRVTVTELVGWEHSMKNELILAERKGAPLPEAQARLAEFKALWALPTFCDRFTAI